MSKRADRHQEMMDALDRDEPAAAPTATPGAAPDSSVPALGAVGDLVRDELRQERARNVELLNRAERAEANAVLAIPARLIRRSFFTDRHELSFQDAEFDSLKESIRAEGRNTQPALVRPLPESEAGEQLYEVVYGRRRHRACLELGLDLHTEVRAVDDREAVRLMRKENRERADPSQFELAQLYRALLDRGIYGASAQEQLAAEEGISQPTLSRILGINDLPAEVLGRIDDPRKVTGKWASKVLPILEADGASALARLAATEGPLTPKALLDVLVPPAALEPRDICVGERRIFQALPERNKAGVAHVAGLRLYVDLNDEKLQKLAAYAAKL